MKMKQKAPRTILLTGFALVIVFGAVCQAQAQDAKAPYPAMAPKNTVETVTAAAMTVLLRKYRPNGAASNASG